MRTARTLEAEWRQVLRWSVITGEKVDELNSERVWAPVFHHVTAHSRLARILKFMNRLFIQFSIFGAALNRGYWISGYGGTAVYLNDSTTVRLWAGEETDENSY
jgi:hypothetical protein